MANIEALAIKVETRELDETIAKIKELRALADETIAKTKELRALADETYKILNM